MKYALLSFSLLLLLQPAMAQRKYAKTDGGPTAMAMVKVQGGSFDLGDDNEALDRKPAHSVTLSDYYMSAYEVTQAQWKAVMGTNPSEYLGGDCPVTNVSYDDIQKFIEKLNSMTGKHYRLPTEAEWEYAARGGTDERLVRQSTAVARGGVNEFLISHPNERVPDREVSGKRYSGKNLPQDVAWYERNSGGHVHPIARKKANQLGIFDMSGNAEEWCSDFYVNNYGSSTPVTNPKGPANGRSHVVRGGSCTSTPAELVVTYRRAYVPATRSSSLGFRLVEDKG